MFKPQIVKKYQTTLSDEIEEKILSMCALRMSYKDISYTRDISSIHFTKKISAITDKIIDSVKKWQSRQLNCIYPFIWLDAIHYKIKDDNSKYVTKAAYTVLGVNLECKKRS